MIINVWLSRIYPFKIFRNINHFMNNHQKYNIYISARLLTKLLFNKLKGVE